MRVSIGEALRFFLELGSIVALGYWGVHASKDLPAQAVLAVGAPAALIIIWALFIAPRAVYPIPRLAQAIAGGLLLEIAAVALREAMETCKKPGRLHPERVAGNPAARPSHP